MDVKSGFIVNYACPGLNSVLPFFWWLRSPPPTNDSLHIGGSALFKAQLSWRLLREDEVKLTLLPAFILVLA